MAFESLFEAIEVPGTDSLRLQRPLIYRDRRGRRHVAPQGFLTDLGSVPWFGRWLVPTWGCGWTKPYVIHDYLCRHGTDLDPPVTRAEADLVMRWAIHDGGHRVRCWPAWVGVRIGAAVGIG